MAILVTLLILLLFLLLGGFGFIFHLLWIAALIALVFLVARVIIKHL